MRGERAELEHILLQKEEIRNSENGASKKSRRGKISAPNYMLKRE